MKNAPILSVVIPIYNVEAYLEHCVNSVLEQDYKNLEVILVDDGSPDRCPQICDELAKKDERVIVFHQSNKGTSYARNVGIKAAKGKYITFLDSDDSWIPGSLSEIMQQIGEQTFDMLVFDELAKYPDGSFRKRNYHGLFAEPFVVLSGVEYYKKLMEIGDLDESSCTKIISRQFLISNDLFFCQGITGEDIEWMFRLLRVAQVVAISNIEMFLCTSRRKGSAQNTIKSKTILDLIHTVDKSIQYYQTYPNATTKTMELSHCAYILSNAIGLLFYVNNKNDKSLLKSELRKRMSVFNYSKHRKAMKAKITYRLLGFNVLVSMLQLYMFLMKKNIFNRKVLVDVKKHNNG